MYKISEQIYFCNVCRHQIDQERIEVMVNVLGLFPPQFKCKSCAELTTNRVQGIYMGASGISDLVYSSKVGSQTGIYRQDEEKQEIIEDIAEGNEEFSFLSNK